MANQTLWKNVKLKNSDKTYLKHGGKNDLEREQRIREPWDRLEAVFQDERLCEMVLQGRELVWRLLS